MKRLKGWIMIFICLFFTGCASSGGLRATLNERIAKPYKENWHEKKYDLARVNFGPAIMTGQPETILIDKAVTIASIVGAPVARPLEKKVINPVREKILQPYVERPIKIALNKVVIQPLIVKPAKFIGRRFRLIKNKPEPIWISNKMAFSLLADKQLLADEIPTLKPSNSDSNSSTKDYFKDKDISKYRPYTKADMGSDPYTGTAQWAINNFNLPKELKAQILKNIRNNIFSWHELENGQLIEEMTHGKNQITRKRMCQWPNDQLYAAKDYGADDYHVVRILECRNWAWWQESKKIILPEEIVAPLKPTAISEAYKPISFQPAKRKSKFFLELSHWEFSSGAFKERFTDHTNVYGRWHVLTWYPLVYQDSRGWKHQFGLAAENLWWKGQTGTKFSFEGGKDLMLGPSYKLNTQNTETYARLTFGEREDEGFIHNSRIVEESFRLNDKEFKIKRKIREKYWMKQNTDILSLYLSHERSSKRKWFRKIRIYTLLDFDVDGAKKAHYRGYDEGKHKFITKKVESFADDKTMYSAGFWLEIYNFRDGLIRPQLGFEVKYYSEGFKTGKRPAFGISFLDDSFLIGVNYTFWNKHFAKSRGLEVWVDFYKLYEYAKERRWRRPAKNFEEIRVRSY